MTKWTFKLVAAGIFYLCSVAFADESTGFTSVQVEPKLIVNQRSYQGSANACGPCSLLHAVRFGDAELQAFYKTKMVGGDNSSSRLRYIVDRYFKTKPSLVIPNVSRFGVHGVEVEDFAQSCNDLLTEAKLEDVTGSYLDRQKSETDTEMLDRIHGWMLGSIERGFPPVLSVRSYVVRSRTENNKAPAFEMGGHHFVTVSSVPSDLDPKAIGFEIEVIDSVGAKQHRIHIHAEPNQQDFRALKGTVTQGVWLSGRPFLLATAPELGAVQPRTLKWSERYIVVVNYLVGRF